MGWVYLVHEETGGSTRVPDSPDVLAMHEARGWTVAVDPGEDERTVAVPGYVPADAEWVELVHPDLPTAVQRVPNHPDAIAGQFAAGWRYPPPPEDVVREELKDIRGGKGGRASKAERAEAEERAAAAAAGTDEPPAAGPVQDDAAGDGAHEKE